MDSAYPEAMNKLVETSRNNRIARMAGLGEGIDVGSKAFFKLSTSLQSLPGAMAYAMKPNGIA